MAIKRPRAINPHRLRPQRSGGWRAGDFLVSRGMRLRRGRKSMDRHCGKVIEAQPTLGQISPSEAAWAPRGQTARRLDDHLAASDKRAAAFAAESSARSHQRRQNGGQRTTGSLPIFDAKPESASWKKTKNASGGGFSQGRRSEFLMPRFVSLVAAEGGDGFASIWSRPRQRLSRGTTSVQSNGKALRWK